MYNTINKLKKVMRKMGKIAIFCAFFYYYEEEEKNNPF